MELRCAEVTHQWKLMNLKNHRLPEGNCHDFFGKLFRIRIVSHEKSAGASHFIKDDSRIRNFS